MCGRYTLRATKKDIGHEFEIEEENLPVIRYGRYNIAPTQDVLAVIRSPETGLRELRLLRWGLIPSWAKEKGIGNKMINARAETVHEKPSFRAAFRARRCLILADGFYEWRTIDKKKIPHFIHLPGERVFAFAGLYEVWNSPEGEKITSCTIITTSANEKMKSLHDRMPVILPDKSAWNSWLDPKNTDPRSLLEPLSDNLIDFYAVEATVNSPRNDTPDCVKRVA